MIIYFLLILSYFIITGFTIRYFSYYQKNIASRINNIRSHNIKRLPIYKAYDDSEKTLFILKELAKKNNIAKEKRLDDKDFFRLSVKEQYLYLQICDKRNINSKILKYALKKRDHMLNYLALKKIQNMRDLMLMNDDISSLSASFLRSRNPILQREAIKLSNS